MSTTTPAITANLNQTINLFNIVYPFSGVPQYIGATEPIFVGLGNTVSSTPTAGDLNYNTLWMDLGAYQGVNLTFTGNVIGSNTATFQFAVIDSNTNEIQFTFGPKVSSNQTLSTVYYNDFSQSRRIVLLCQSNDDKGFQYPQRIDSAILTIVGIYGFDV